MGTTTNDRRGQLIRRLHTLKTKAGISRYDYEALLESHGVRSSTEMTERQLEAACGFLQQHLGGGAADADKQRKRLIAAVCSFCEDVVPGWEKMSDAERIGYAKAIACRAAGWDDVWDSHGRSRFNTMGLDRLRSLTYAFQKRKKDMDGVVEAVMAKVEDDPSLQPELYREPKTKTLIS